jgi:hypothetical protein
MANASTPGGEGVAAAALLLRPLSIGELLDRAFSLFFKNIIPLISLLAIVIVPWAIIQYFMTRDVLGLEFDLIMRALSHPTQPPDQAEIARISQAAVQSRPLVGLNYLFTFILVPFANAAVVVGISRAYLGQQIRFKDCYAVALQRWLYVLALVLMWLVTLLGAIIVVFLVFVFGVLLLAAVAAALKTLGAVIAIVFGIIGFLALFGVIIMGYMAFASSMVALMLERVDPVRSFVLGFDRIFGGGLFWRSLLMALAMVAVFFGFGLVAGGLGALLVWATKSPAMYVAAGEVANIFYVAFAFVVVALYYYDVRIRREGFDLQLLADQMARTQGPASG